MPNFSIRLRDTTSGRFNVGKAAPRQPRVVSRAGQIEQAGRPQVNGASPFGGGGPRFSQGLRVNGPKQ